jgi:hypothetical protein
MTITQSELGGMHQQSTDRQRFLFHFLGIENFPKFNKIISKIICIHIRKPNFSKFLPISLSKNAEISPQKETAGDHYPYMCKTIMTTYNICTHSFVAVGE